MVGKTIRPCAKRGSGAIAQSGEAFGGSTLRVATVQISLLRPGLLKSPMVDLIVSSLPALAGTTQPCVSGVVCWKTRLNFLEELEQATIAPAKACLTTVKKLSIRHCLNENSSMVNRYRCYLCCAWNVYGATTSIFH